MTDYLKGSFDLSTPEVVSVFDELPLWSSYFGAVILAQIPLPQNAKILDIGCGAGFPLIEIAQRAGKTTRVFGIDPWGAALDRVREKLRIMRIDNVELIEGAAESIPFGNNYFDVIVSNNGINNVKDSIVVMKEVFRVLKLNGKVVFTVNLPDTMKEFYSAFRQALTHFDLNDEQKALENHIYSKRKTLQTYIDLIRGCGLEIENITTDEFKMRYADGTAMLNHYFIRLAFLDSWKKIIPENLSIKFFGYLESELNQKASGKGELSLSIPFVCFTCRRPDY